MLVLVLVLVLVVVVEKMARVFDFVQTFLLLLCSPGSQVRLLVIMVGNRKFCAAGLLVLLSFSCSASCFFLLSRKKYI